MNISSFLHHSICNIWGNLICFVLHSGQYLIIQRIQFHFIIIRIPLPFIPLSFRFPSLTFSDRLVPYEEFFGNISTCSVVCCPPDRPLEWRKKVCINLYRIGYKTSISAPNKIKMIKAEKGKILSKRENFVYVCDGIMNLNLNPSTIES